MTTDPPSATTDPAHPGAGEAGPDLGTRASRSGAFMLLSSGLQSAVSIGAILVLVRLLPPADFGLVAMATAVTGFASVARDFGVPHATVHVPTLEPGSLAALLRLNARLSVGLALLTALVAPAAAWFFGRPEVTAIVCALALATLFSGLANVHMGLLRRTLNFGRIAVVELTAVVVGAGVGITAAVLGAGPWALVAKQLALGATTGVGLRVASGRRPDPGPVAGRADPPGHRPDATTDGPDLRSIRAYGRDVTWTTLLNYLAREFHGFLIGRFAGAAALGIYNAALRWALFPVRQLHLPLLGVAVSTLSRLQDEPERYRMYFRTFASSFYLVVIPVAALLFLTADDVVLFLLGEPWAEAIPLFRILVWGALGYAANRVVKWCYLSEGRTREHLTWNAVTAVVVLTALAVGLPGGPDGVARGYTTAMVALVLPAFGFCARRSPLRVSDFLRPALVPTLGALAGTALIVTVQPGWLESVARPVRLGVRMGLFGAGAGVAVGASPSGRELLRNALDLVHRRRTDDGE